MLDPVVQQLLSPSNPLIKRLLHLRDARGRREQGLFLVEGRRAIDEFLCAGWRPEHLFLRDDCERVASWPASTTVSGRVVERLSQATTPSGYLAVFPIPQAPPLRAGEGGVILADIADPGNLGTLLRTSAAMGVRQAVLIGSCDPWSAKAVQSSAGALARLEIHTPEAPPAVEALSAGAPWCALMVHGGLAPEELPRGPRWLVIGGEARGIPELVLQRCQELVTLPMPGGTESLNAAVAGAIACYLLLRKRP